MKLSIVVPTLNEESVLEKTLKQIRDNLTAFDYELIVTDDGSRDRTLEIAKRYATKLVQGPNPQRTIATNRNKGGREASGEFLVFVDADIFIPKPNEFFKTLLARFAADPKLMGATVNIKIFPNEATWADNAILMVTNSFVWLSNNFFHFGAASGEFQMMRRSAFEALHGYREHIAVDEDQDMFRRLAKMGHTRIERQLTVYNDGRRPHSEGWGVLMWGWVVNYVWVGILGKSYAKSWNVIRYPKLSFVIPAYNEEHYLGDCLDSIIKQRDALPYNTEIIVVNNSSTDRTEAIAKSHKGVRVVLEKQKGLVHARQAGFLAATGDIIANVDADTRLTSGWTKKVMASFIKDKKLVALSGPFIYYDTPRAVRFFVRFFYLIGYCFYLINRFILHAGSMVQGGNFVLRRDALQKIGGFDTKISFYGEDTDIARRMNKVGKVRFTFGLPIYSSGRRLAKEGALTIGLRYALNYFWITFFERPFSTSYVDIRPEEAQNGGPVAYAPKQRWKEWLIGVSVVAIFLAIAGGIAYLIYRLVAR